MPEKNKNNLVSLRKHLRGKTQRELIDEIAWLYKSFENVKDYYQASALDNDAAVLEKYKEKIEFEFFPKSWRQDPPARISVAKKAISEYRKVCCSDQGLADIMLFYVEIIIRFSREHGYPDYSLFNSALLIFGKSLEHIYNCDLIGVFETRLKAVLDDAAEADDCFYWEMSDLLYRYVNEDYC